MKEGVPHFSFEYQLGYEVVLVVKDYKYRYTDVVFVGPLVTEKQARALLVVFVNNWENGAPRLEEEVEEQLSTFCQWLDFRLLRRSSLMVDGIEAEQIVFF